jgi:hypothetical protein
VRSPTELGGGRRLPDACAGPEVDSVSKMYLEEFEANRQKPLKMQANQGPQDEGPDSEAPGRGVPGCGGRHRSSYFIGFIQPFQRPRRSAWQGSPLQACKQPSAGLPMRIRSCALVPLVPHRPAGLGPSLVAHQPLRIRSGVATLGGPRQNRHGIWALAKGGNGS